MEFFQGHPLCLLINVLDAIASQEFSLRFILLPWSCQAQDLGWGRLPKYIVLGGGGLGLCIDLNMEQELDN